MQEKPFSNNVRRKETFNPVKEVFGSDVPLPKEEHTPRKRTQSPHAPIHDKPFKPSNPPKKGYNRTLDKFPEYKPDPMKPLERKKPVEGAEERPNFKPSYNKKSMPVKPVATNLRNLKSEFPSIFRRL